MKQRINIVSFGAGTNSTALIIEMINRKVPIDLIIFSDTGGEKPETYQFIKTFESWIVEKIGRTINIVQQPESLEDECLRRESLPSIVYGFKSCSEKFKIRPFRKFVNTHFSHKQFDRHIYVGIDAGETHRARQTSSPNETHHFPLIDWEIDREECIEIIKKEGIALPGKSACFFCPSSKKGEVFKLKEDHPELYERAVKMEQNAHLTKIAGLGRHWSWYDLTKQMSFDFPEPPDIGCWCDI